MFDVVNKRDDILDAADNDDGDDANKKSPLTIEKTRSMRWKMTETIWTPTKQRL
jgi:hypothetical protein